MAIIGTEARRARGDRNGRGNGEPKGRIFPRIIPASYCVENGVADLEATGGQPEREFRAISETLYLRPTFRTEKENPRCGDSI